MDLFFPFQALADGLVYGLFALSPQGQLGPALNFFIYDSLKILTLLLVIIFGVSLLRSFLPPEKVRDHLARMPRLLAHLAAGALGMVTPFCSCSAVPLFLGFVEAGVPLGVTFTFLVASPMINEVALVMLLGMFGWHVALLYLVSGLVIAVIAGIVIGKLQVENLLESYVLEMRGKRIATGEFALTWKDRALFALDYTQGIIAKVWVWVLLGVGIGAWIHGYVPADFLASVAGRDVWYAVPLATLIGIPLYSNAAGVLPMIGVLTEKGVAMGTALSFMMAVTALSIPEFLILRNVMKVRLIGIFALVVGIGIMLTGFLFNLVL